MKNNKAFTIVELIAVVLILGILSSIAVMSVSRIRHQANTKEIESLRSSIIDAFNDYRIDNSVSKNKNINISNLEFDKGLTFNNNKCTLDNEDTIKYIVKGDYYSTVNDNDRLKYGVCMTETKVNGTKTETKCTETPSKAEGFCIKLVCNGVTVIDDYEDATSLCKYAK